MSTLNLNEFTNFEPLSGDWFNLWTVAKCEECGTDCEGPNSVKLRGAGLARAIDRAGLTFRAPSSTAGELGWCDALDSAVCPDCYVDEEEDCDDYDDSMCGDHASALASAGFGTDEDYGCY